MKINRMNEYVSWSFIWAIGCAGCNTLVSFVFLTYEELKIIAVILAGMTIMWWILFLVLYVRDRNTLKNSIEVEGKVIGESFRVIFSGRNEFVVRAMVITGDNQIFHFYTSIYCLDYYKIKKNKMTLPCRILINEKKKKHTIIHFPGTE